MRWSNHGDEAEEKQQSSNEEEPEQMQNWGDQDEAVHKQPRVDEDKESQGLNHPGQNKKERPKRNDHKRRRKETQHPRDWNIRGGTSSRGRHPPGLEHLRTSGGKTPRTGASGTEQGAGAAALWTGTSEDRRRPNATDGNVDHGEHQKQTRGQGSGVAAKRSGGRRRGEAEKPR